MDSLTEDCKRRIFMMQLRFDAVACVSKIWNTSTLDIKQQCLRTMLNTLDDNTSNVKPSPFVCGLVMTDIKISLLATLPPPPPPPQPPQPPPPPPPAGSPAYSHTSSTHSPSSPSSPA